VIRLLETILVVEDHDDSRRMLEDVLTLAVSPQRARASPSCATSVPSPSCGSRWTWRRSSRPCTACWARPINGHRRGELDDKEHLGRPPNSLDTSVDEAQRSACAALIQRSL